MCKYFIYTIWAIGSAWCWSLLLFFHPHSASLACRVFFTERILLIIIETLICKSLPPSYRQGNLRLTELSNIILVTELRHEPGFIFWLLSSVFSLFHEVACTAAKSLRHYPPDTARQTFGWGVPMGCHLSKTSAAQVFLDLPSRLSC